MRFDKLAERFLAFVLLQLNEIFQDVQADIAGFFGVELRCENIFKLNRRSDFFAVSGRRRDNFFVVGRGVIAVHEIKIRFAA